MKIYFALILLFVLTACDRQSPATPGRTGQDAEIANFLAHSSHEEVATASPWSLSEGQNPVDDSRIVIATNISTGFEGQRDNIPTLNIQCYSGNTSVFIEWHRVVDYDTDNDTVPITIRFGMNRAERQLWLKSNESTGTFVPNDEISFIRKLISVKRFVAQTTPFNSNEVTAVFDLDQTGAAAKRVAAACGWKI